MNTESTVELDPVPHFPTLSPGVVRRLALRALFLFLQVRERLRGRRLCCSPFDSVWVSYPACRSPRAVVVWVDPSVYSADTVRLQRPVAGPSSPLLDVAYADPATVEWVTNLLGTAAHISNYVPRNPTLLAALRHFEEAGPPWAADLARRVYEHGRLPTP